MAMTTQAMKIKNPIQLSSTSQKVRYDSNPRPLLTIESRSRTGLRMAGVSGRLPRLLGMQSNGHHNPP